MLQFRKQPIVAVSAEPIAPPAKPTQVMLARTALASAEQALAMARSKDTEAFQQLKALKALPPADTVQDQVTIESQCNALLSVRDRVAREISDAAALAELRRSELESTIERATQAQTQLAYRQKHLDERRIVLDRMLTARPAVEAIIDDSTWRVAPSVYAAANTILSTIASLAQDVQLYQADVTKLQAQVAFWGEL